MIKEVVAAQMDALGLPYAYWEFPRDGEQAYYVGERVESQQTQEDGARRGTFTISGWSYAGPSPLDEAESLLRSAFADLRVRDALGTCCVGYSHATEVPSDVEGMCRVDYALDYIEWDA